jgi:hypothetical protein
MGTEEGSGEEEGVESQITSRAMQLFLAMELF